MSAAIASLKVCKAPGYDLILGKVLQEIPPTADVLLTTLYNSMLRLYYCPLLRKFAKLIMVPKPGKPTHEVTSYRTISLLPILSKIFENLLLKRHWSDVDLSYQFPDTSLASDLATPPSNKRTA